MKNSTDDFKLVGNALNNHNNDEVKQDPYQLQNANISVLTFPVGASMSMSLEPTALEPMHMYALQVDLTM